MAQSIGALLSNTLGISWSDPTEQPGAAPAGGSSADVCVPNIGPEERRRRLIGGAVALGVGVGLAGLMVVADVDRWWRVALLLPFWSASLGYFQAAEKT